MLMHTPHATGGDDVVSSKERPNWSGVELEFKRFDREVSFEIPSRYEHLIILHCSGTGTLFQRRGQRTETNVVTPGNMLFLPARTTAYLSWNMPHSHLGLMIAPEMLAAATSAQNEGSLIQLLDVFDRRDTLIHRFGMSLLDELNFPDQPAQRIVVESTSRALVTHLVRSFTSQAGQPDDSGKEEARLTAPYLSRVLQHIEANFGRKITLDDLAGLANVGRFYFSRLFKQSMGVSPMAYVEQRRVRRARELIASGRYTLAEIAVAVGFADQSHFTRRFNLHCGLTPAVFARSQGVVGRSPRKGPLRR
jgi:AraC family transcriptional regulator